mgnify:CR=1 FL=1
MKQVLGSNLVYYRNFSVYMIYMLQLSIFGHILGKNEHFNFLLLLDLHSDLSDSGFYILRLTMGGIIRFPGVWIYPCNNHHCSNHSILSYCGDWIGRMIWWPYRTWYRLHNMLNACFTRVGFSTSPLNDRSSGSEVSLILSYWSKPNPIDPLVPASRATELV